MDRRGGEWPMPNSERRFGSDGVGMFVGADVERFFNFRLDDLRAVFRVADDGVVVHREFLPANLRLENLRTFLDFVAETNAMVLAEELQHGEQFTVRHGVAFDGGIDTGTEHL